MKFRNDSIEIHGWQLILLAIVALAAIGAITYVALDTNERAIEEAKIVQEEKSERGHWLWGHWDDVAEKEN